MLEAAVASIFTVRMCQTVRRHLRRHFVFIVTPIGLTNKSEVVSVHNWVPHREVVRESGGAAPRILFTSKLDSRAWPLYLRGERVPLTHLMESCIYPKASRDRTGIYRSFSPLVCSLYGATLYEFLVWTPHFVCVFGNALCRESVFCLGTEFSIALLRVSVACVDCTQHCGVNLLKPTGYVMHQQFNIQQLYVLPTLYLCVLYLSQNKQRLVPLTA